MIGVPPGIPGYGFTEIPGSRSLRLSLQRMKLISQRSLAKEQTAGIGTWTTKEVTLSLVPSQFSDQCQLFFVLYSFNNHFHIQVPSQGQN